MSEFGEALSRPEGLNPGDVISLSDMRELVQFEDALLPFVDSIADPLLWQSRLSVGDLLRPAKFNGTIRDISLTVMDGPYERLLDARDRGRQIKDVGSKSFERRQTGARQLIDKYYGFVFDAEAYSTNPDLRGRIGAELWYYPHPKYKSTKLGEAIRRVVTKPQYDKQRFEAAFDRSRTIGFKVLAEAMRNTKSTPMQD